MSTSPKEGTPPVRIDLKGTHLKCGVMVKSNLQSRHCDSGCLSFCSELHAIRYLIHEGHISGSGEVIAQCVNHHQAQTFHFRLSGKRCAVVVAWKNGSKKLEKIDLP